MDVEPGALLREVLQGLCGAEPEFPHQIRHALQALSAHLPVESCSLSLLAPAPGRSAQVLRQNPGKNQTSPGAALSNEPGWHPLLENGTMTLPVDHGGQRLALLHLHGVGSPEPLTPWRTELTAAGCLLASLILTHTAIEFERHRNTRLQCLTEIMRRINQAQTVREMLKELLGALIRTESVVFVAVHPTGTEALQWELTANYRSARPGLMELAARLHAQVRDKGDLIRPERLEQPHLQALALPLNFQQRLLGSLIVVTRCPEDDNALPTGVLDSAFLCSLAVQVAESWGRIAALQSLARISRDNDRKLREISFLYHLSRAMHGTRGLDELVHFILSVSVLPEGPGCDRAMLFLYNERSRYLQGMLGVTRSEDSDAWTPQIELHLSVGPLVPPDVQRAQQTSALSRLVRQLRLSIDDRLSPVARAAREQQVIMVSAAEGNESETGEPLTGSYLCVPLLGRDRLLAVLVADNCENALQFDEENLRVLELFAHQAGAAMESAMLVQQLKSAHYELRSAQEDLLQTEKLATIGEFAASVAHELKNPLVCVGGFAQRLLKNVEEGTKAWQYAEIITREVRRVENMLNNILSFSKRRMMCFAPCNIVEVIGSALALVSRELTESGIFIEQQIDPDLPTIVGDENQLRQVLLNLFNNARDAMNEGGILTVRAFPSTLRGDPAVTIEVTDTGGGISAEALRNIFNPFFTTKATGTGLGLPICHRIIEHHRGSISVVNREKGASFSLQIPQELVHAHTA
jgi:two-component system, NtrC family, sensor histidine kinase HydH